MRGQRVSLEVYRRVLTAAVVLRSRNGPTLVGGLSAADILIYRFRPVPFTEVIRVDTVRAGAVAEGRRDSRGRKSSGLDRFETYLLEFLEIGRELLRYIVDRGQLKQRLCTSGTRIPVVAPERLLADQPDCVLLFAWNFIDEIVAQQVEHLKRGGKFIIPVLKSG